MKIIIVGSVAGDMSAATRLRRLMEDAEIIVFDFLCQLRFTLLHFWRNSRA
ncbi:coenzyme A disulfide reductase [Streptococcus suis]|nr:coenzyme A disulfide reductase [Streptococcus suis]CYV51895.1 coenzyme A disulfide reductase [Streptococcus suis]